MIATGPVKFALDAAIIIGPFIACFFALVGSKYLDEIRWTKELVKKQ
jgi:hypothetical protein